MSAALTAPRAASLALALGAAVVGAWSVASGSTYSLRVLTLAGVFALASLGYQFIFGHAGALALSQGAFMGIGAYASAILATRFGLRPEAGFAAAILAPVAVAAAVALPVLRLRTHYFALATLMVAQVASLVATNWESVTGGANGLSGIPPPALFGVAVRTGWPMLALVWSLVALGAATLSWSMRGRRGDRFALLRANADAARSVGIDTARLRLLAFLASAAYAGAAGALYVTTIRVVSPDVLGFPLMVTLLTIAVVGGRTRIAGAILGAVLVVELPERIRVLRDAYLLVYGCILLLTVVAMPDGLAGAAQRLAGRLGLPDRPPPGRPASAVPATPVALRHWIRGRPGEVLLEVADVSRDFGGVRALDGVSLSVRAGEVVGLIGPNGSGKTTLVNVITRLLPAGSGHVRFAGRDVTRLSAFRLARAGIARTFQSPALAGELTALENVAVAGDVSGAASTLAAMGAAGDAGRRADTLPDAARRRVEIARALALRPRLLLLDEPAAGLGPGEQAEFARHLRRVTDAGVALLIVEHDIAFLAALCDRLVCLDAGRVIADGAPAAVRADPRVVAAYLGTPDA